MKRRLGGISQVVYLSLSRLSPWATKHHMQCILIGVSPPCPEAWKIVNEHLVEYDDYVINWISNSKATYEGQSVDLLCAVTEAPLVDDIVTATAHVISDNTSTCHICELWDQVRLY